MSMCNTEKAVDEMDARERARYIDALTPKGGLYTEVQREVHPQSNSSWRVSPDPWRLPPPVLSHLEALGQHLYQFYKALNLLYSQSIRGIQPAWVAQYLDQGQIGRSDQIWANEPIQKPCAPRDSARCDPHASGNDCDGIGLRARWDRIYSKPGRAIRQTRRSNCGRRKWDGHGICTDDSATSPAQTRLFWA